jgi:hypothetical protein
MGGATGVSAGGAVAGGAVAAGGVSAGGVAGGTFSGGVAGGAASGGITAGGIAAGGGPVSIGSGGTFAPAALKSQSYWAISPHRHRQPVNSAMNDTTSITV